MRRTTTRPSVLLLAVPLLALGVALMALNARPSDTLDASSVLAKSRDGKAQVAAQATEGKVLHYLMKEYLRQGPAAPIVQEMKKDDFYVPESVSTEAWFLVGPSGRIVRMYGRRTDDAGNVVQEVTTEGKEVVSRAPASGAEERTPLPDRSVQDIANDMGAEAQRLEENVAGDAAKVVGYGDVGGKKTIVLEVGRESEPQPEEPVAGATSGGYSLPFTLDLGAVQRIERLEVDAESFLPYRWWMVAVDAAGDEHLISEVVTVAYDVLDAAAAPVPQEQDSPSDALWEDPPPCDPADLAKPYDGLPPPHPLEAGDPVCRAPPGETIPGMTLGSPPPGTLASR
jgi:hypothetical protein